MMSLEVGPDRETPPVSVVTWGSGSILPSKEVIMVMFREFGGKLVFGEFGRDWVVFRATEGG